MSFGGLRNSNAHIYNAKVPALSNQSSIPVQKCSTGVTNNFGYYKDYIEASNYKDTEG
jgi:hypothetical protein